MAVSLGPEIVNNGLVLHLDAANSRSYPGTGTIWTDLSRNGNNGTLTNGPTFNSTNNGRFVFDGVNDFVSVPSIGSTTMTYGIWFNSSNFGTSTFGCSLFKIPSNSSGCLGISTSTSEFTYKVGGFSDGQEAYTSGNNLQINTWYCLYFIRNNLEVGFYLNGNPILCQTFSQGPGYKVSLASGAGLPNITAVGQCDTANDRGYFSGSIPFVQIYNRVLSDVEIKQNFEAMRGRFGI